MEFRWGFSFFFGLLAGCTKTSSEGVATSAVWAEFSILQNPTTIDARAEFRATEGGTYVELASGDRISCNGVALGKVQLGNAIWYSESVAGVFAGGSYTFELTRAANNETSTAAVAPPLALGITTPSAMSLTRLGQPLTVTWSPATNSDTVGIRTSGACIDGLDLSDIADDGTETIGGATGITGTGTSCSGTLDVSRYHREPLGAPFKGGTRFSSYTSEEALLFGP